MIVDNRTHTSPTFNAERPDRMARLELLVVLLLQHNVGVPFIILRRPVNALWRYCQCYTRA